MSPRNVRAKNDKYRKSGEIISKRRGELGLTQEALAAQIDKRLTRQRLQNWEKGVAMPRPAEMEKLATALLLTVDEITRGERFQGVRDTPVPAPSLSSNAQTIGKMWDALPRAGQEYITEQILSMFQFQEEDPDMAAHVLATPSSAAMKRLKEHEKKLESVQEQMRRTPVNPNDEDDKS